MLTHPVSGNSKVLPPWAPREADAPGADLRCRYIEKLFLRFTQSKDHCQVARSCMRQGADQWLVDGDGRATVNSMS